MEHITEDRIKKVKEVWNKMHGRLAPGFRWLNHSFTPYYYDEENDSFNCMEVSIPIDMPTEEISYQKLSFLVDDLRNKVFLHYRDKHNIDLGYICFD